MEPQSRAVEAGRGVVGVDDDRFDGRSAVQQQRMGTRSIQRHSAARSPVAGGSATEIQLTDAAVWAANVNLTGRLRRSLDPRPVVRKLLPGAATSPAEP